ncbi:MAG: molybdopterin synthase sulfur carrier subunit [Desulfobulbaceae bacterium S3730MH12]|nr:MAG: molybdopterin synthase sulfur carrier subunit [Desulfobulbaceae bacterium S5133MH15]OEU57714.1 MAG: molybdopterin synthase sulfur carrier subunit [Desulfobulbaceae bacterium S3730MH12]OEU81010.1 MAG: molybdopterin synthase sulfur carrier subunit [Desulfobulbaceae bacterium C00003063]
MKVTIKLFAFFRESRFKIENRDLEKGTTVGNIVDVLGIDRKEIGVLMINSRHTTLETELSENDILAIFPVIGGG